MGKRFSCASRPFSPQPLWKVAHTAPEGGGCNWTYNKLLYGSGSTIRAMTPKKLKGIRMSATTIRKLQKLAKSKETTESDIIRRLIDRAAKDNSLEY
jgi:hypothetical protein